MDITFSCTKCGQHIAIDEAGAGMSVQCPKCDASLTVPQLVAQQSHGDSSCERAFPLHWIIVGASALLLLAIIVATLTQWRLASGSQSGRNAGENTKAKSSASLDDKYWGEGVEDYRSCKVIAVIPGGFLTEGAIVASMALRFTNPQVGYIGTDYRVVAIVKHPRERTLTEGENVKATWRREGIVEGKDINGVFRRLPRWVYVSDK